MEENKITEQIEETASEPKAEDSKNSKKVKKQKALLPPRVEYAKRADKYSRFYINLLAAVGVGGALAIIVAVMKDVLIGLAIGIITALLYKYFVTDELSKSLGVSYKSREERGIRIVRARARYGNEYWIPKKLMMMEVTEVSDGAFKTVKNVELECVHLPKTLIYIGKDIFETCDALHTVCFEGDEKLWESIEKETDFSSYELQFDVAYPRVKKKKTQTKKVDTKAINTDSKITHVDKDKEEIKKDAE